MGDVRECTKNYFGDEKLEIVQNDKYLCIFR